MHLNNDLTVWRFKQENLLGDVELMTGRNLHNVSTFLINSHLATGVIEFKCWNQNYVRDLEKDQP